MNGTCLQPEDVEKGRRQYEPPRLSRWVGVKRAVTRLKDLKANLQCEVFAEQKEE